MKQLSSLTKGYLLIVYALGGYFFVSNLSGPRLVLNPGLLIVFALVGGVLHTFKVEGSTNRSHFTTSFIIFGFFLVLTGNPDFFIVILVANLIQWAITPPPAWYIQPFNIGCYMIAAQAANFIYTAINPTRELTSTNTILAIVVSAAGFTVLNHFIIGLILWLARGENFKKSGAFGVTPVLIDLTMLSLGASLAIIWAYNPYALILFIIPLYPFYKTLKIPALERKTEIEPKTGLFNHGYFMSQLKHELQRANRYDRPLSLIMADLDLLRNINNSYGHLAGDEVLKGIASILKETVRQHDVVARFGGEEFAILMPEATLEQALQKAELIRKAVESYSFTVPTSVDPIKITMSLGVSSREDFEQSGEEIIHDADTALYKAKIKGRNMVSPYSRTLPQELPISSSDGESTLSPAIPSKHAERKDTTTQSASPTVETVATETPSAAAQEGYTVSSNHPETHHVSSRKVYLYITAVALSASLIFALGFKALQLPLSPATIRGEWIILGVLVLLTILTETFSISLYVGNTSISTTAIPLIAGFILFGPLGTILCSAAYAVTTAIKFRSQFNRLIFNFSNHVIAGTLVNLMVSASGVFLQDWNIGLQLLYTLASSIVTYFVTTALISIGMGIDLKQPPLDVWKEQFQWMAIYYMGIGFVSYSFIFGYQQAELLGIVFIIVPLLLLRYSQVQYVEHTREIVKKLRKKNQDLEKSANDIHELSEGLLTTLSEIIDLRDPYVLGHSKQVSIYATEIAKELNINNRQSELIRKAGLLHDIGKLGIPLELLTKASSLTDKEYETIKKHAELGSDLVKNTPSLRPLSQIIRHHHEKYDGTGYPDQVTGNQIGVEARIVAVADAIEAMTSDRPYRRALKLGKVKDELLNNSGTQFDPLVVDAAIKVLDRMFANETTSPEQGEARPQKSTSQLTVEPRSS